MSFGAAVGLFAGAVDSGMKQPGPDSNQSTGPVLRRTFGTLAKYAVSIGAMGLAYETTKCYLEDLRGKYDFWNTFAGGCAAGAIVGIQQKRLTAGVGGCVVLGLVGVADYSIRVADTRLEKHTDPMLTQWKQMKEGKQPEESSHH